MRHRSYPIALRLPFAAALLIACLACAGPVSGQNDGDAAAVAAAGNSEVAALEQRIQSLENAAELDEGVRARALAAYRQALAAIQRRDGARAEAQAFDQLIAGGRQQIEDVNGAIARLERAEREVRVPRVVSVAEGRPLLEQAKAEVVTLTAQLQEIRSQLRITAARPAAIRDEIAREKALLSELEAQRADLAEDTTLAAEVREGRSQSLRAQQAASQATLERLDKELLAQPIQAALLEARRRETAARLRLAEHRAAQLELALAEVQRSEALQAIADAGVEIPPEAADHPTVVALREDNVATAATITDLTDRRAEVRDARDAVAARAAELQEAYERAQRQLEVAGANQVIGRILLEERRSLPDLASYRSRLAQREDRVQEAGLRALELERERDRLEEHGAYLDRRFEPLGDVDPAVTRAVEDLLTAREQLLTQAIEANEQYLARLSELAFEEEGLLRIAQEFDDFLDERLLWIRSSEAVGAELPAMLAGDLESLADRAWWAGALEAVLAFLRQPLGIIATLAFACWFFLRRSLLNALRRTAEGVGKPSVDTFMRTLRALGWTLVLAAPGPLYLLLVGTGVRATGGEDDLIAPAIGGALVGIVPIAFSLSVLRVMCVTRGLATGHFRWQESGVWRLRRAIDLLWPTLIVPGFALLILSGAGEVFRSGELVRLLLLTILATLGIFLFRLLQPRTGIGAALRARSLEDMPRALNWAAFVLAIALPIVLAVEALYGYVYSVGMLLPSVVYTLVLLGAFLLVQEVVFRWVLVARRRIQLRQILARREAARAAAAEEAGEGAGPESIPVEDDGTHVDVDALDEDTRKLVRITALVGVVVGVFWIWSDLLPAFTALDGVTLWKTSAGAGPDGALRNVSLADVLFGLLIAGLTAFAARNVPSAIEIALRQNEMIARGSRMAFATLTRYAIVVIGIFSVLNLLGASWSKLQWLVAALSVGIGFGLQEIVANFISGLIILVERPIRVGDVVTVGEVEGVVTRIQIRATTVTNWQRMEHLVPNREFITGRVTNWSLSDEVTRVDIAVGVAYGSHVERALEILREVARAHPAVLEEPNPFIGFLAFGDNTLDLSLRVYVASIGDRLTTLNDLHVAINRRFEDEGIVIAFPQRDLHIDRLPPIDVRIQGRADDPAPGPAPAIP